jgi:hypothetical protein
MSATESVIDLRSCVDVAALHEALEAVSRELAVRTRELAEAREEVAHLLKAAHVGEWVRAWVVLQKLELETGELAGALRYAHALGARGHLPVQSVIDRWGQIVSSHVARRALVEEAARAGNQEVAGG